jgi:3D (Asp-Asp-Asp) domain-containing protein/peptidoglycan hydrolase CwlO-like protein
MLVLGAPADVPAQSPGVGRLREQQAELEAQSRAAVVELYGLESRLAQARSDLARVQARAEALARAQTSALRRLRAARQTMATAEHRLGDQLRYLYEQGEPDPIAVVLGATTLEEAIDGLEAVRRAAGVTQAVLDGARAARARLAAVRQALAARALRTRQTRSRLIETAAGLEDARAERTSYLAGLRRRQELTAAQISTLEQQAQEARRRALVVSRLAATPEPSRQADAFSPATPAPETVAQAPETAPSEPPPAPVESVSSGAPAAPAAAPPPPRPGGTMTVYATGYCLTGTTATGLPVGPGIVATDPSVVPLGTRMTIPGYGEGVAADTGGAIKGRRIDVWIKSCADAAAFGRTVTITFH